MPLPSPQLVPIAREMAGNRLLLSFSGRDSLAMWLWLRDRGFELIPYWCYTVPHLSYDDEMIDYYERYFGCSILRLPAPETYRLLNVGAWQPPRARALLDHMDLVQYGWSDIEDMLAERFDLPATYLSAVGMKAADYLMRLRLSRQMGRLERQAHYYTLCGIGRPDVRASLQRTTQTAKCYLTGAARATALNIVLRYLKDNLPDDYQRVLDVFPLAEAELFRYEQVK
jgi:hypothetical protein